MTRPRDELSPSDQRDRLLVSGPAVLYSLDLVGPLRISAVSPNVREMVGLGAADVLGDPRSLMDRVHPQDRPALRHGIIATVRHGSWISEYRMADARGRWLWVRDHLRLVRDGAGNPVEVAGVIVDITEQRSFDLTLRRDHSELARLLEMMPVGVVVVDARTRRLLIGGGAVAALVGEERTDSYAQQLERYGGFWPGTDVELGLMDWPLNRTLRTGETVHDVIADVRRADGGRVTVSMSTTPVTDPDGSVVAAAMVFLDVTEREAILRQTAAALEAERQARAIAERSRSMVESLQRLSARFAAVLSRADLIRVLLGPVSTAVGAHELWLGTVAPGDVARVIISNVEGFRTGVLLPLDTPLPGCRAINTGRSQWIDAGSDVVREWPAIRAFAGDPTDAIAALPLRRGTETFGVLVLRWSAPYSFEPQFQSMLLALVEVIAQAVQRVQLLEHERAVARALQDSMMLQSLPTLEGVELAAVYQAAGDDLEVGGDWYDVLPFPDGRIGVAVGDVMGRGLRAATAMGQLRSALAALAGSFDDPATVLERLDDFAGRVDGAWLASVFYGIVDPVAHTLRYCTAGHVPPLIADAHGAVTLVQGGRSGLLGAPDSGARASAICDLPGASTLLLYTDGLVEQRGSDIAADCAQLAARVESALRGASEPGAPELTLEDLCDALVAQAPTHSDDVALLALRLAGGDQIAAFHGSASGARGLAPLRAELRTWLAQLDLSEDAQYDVLLAAGEACANSVEHAYGDGDGPVQVVGLVRRRTVELTVTDRGTWIGPPSESQRGQGLLLMRALVDDVSVRAAGSGTVVTLTRSLSG
jgi:PAS domain S-box-containing protein